jgi:hypothetical protein
MKNGLMTIEKTDESTKAVFIDQEALECARLNMRTKERVNEGEIERRNKARAKKRIERVRNRIFANAGIGAAVAFAGLTGMIHALLWVPVAIGFLCLGCIGIGAYMGMGAK